MTKCEPIRKVPLPKLKKAAARHSRISPFGNSGTTSVRLSYFAAPLSCLSFCVDGTSPPAVLPRHQFTFVTGCFLYYVDLKAASREHSVSLHVLRRQIFLSLAQNSTRVSLYPHVMALTDIRSTDVEVST